MSGDSIEESGLFIGFCLREVGGEATEEARGGEACDWLFCPSYGLVYLYTYPANQKPDLDEQFLFFGMVFPEP